MKKIQIKTPESSTFPIRLAARELRRYLYVRTGILASLDDRVEGEQTLELLTDTALPDQGFRLHRRDCIGGTGSVPTVNYGNVLEGRPPCRP